MTDGQTRGALHGTAKPIIPYSQILPKWGLKLPSHEAVYISYSNPVLYPPNLSSPSTLFPETWVSYQPTLYVQPFVNSSFLYWTQKCPTLEDTAFPATVSSDDCWLYFFFSPSSWPFQNVCSSFFLKIPSISEGYDIKQCPSPYFILNL